MNTCAPFTKGDALAVARILDAIVTGKRAEWIGVSMRAIKGTVRNIMADDEGRGFLDADADVRTGFLWISSTFEFFIPMTDVISMMADNLFVIEEGK